MLLCMNVSDADQVYKHFLMLFDSSTEAPNIPVHTHTDTGQQVLANQSQTVRFWTALAKATMDTCFQHRRRPAVFTNPSQAVRFWTALAKATTDTGLVHVFNTDAGLQDSPTSDKLSGSAQHQQKPQWTQACSTHQPVTGSEVVVTSRSLSEHRTGTGFQQ